MSKKLIIFPLIISSIQSIQPMFSPALLIARSMASKSTTCIPQASYHTKRQPHAPLNPRALQKIRSTYEQLPSEKQQEFQQKIATNLEQSTQRAACRNWHIIRPYVAALAQHPTCTITLKNQGLEKAVNQEDPCVAQWLLYHHADPNFKNKYEHPLISQAKDIQMALLLLEFGAICHFRFAGGRNLLHLIASDPDYDPNLITIYSAIKGLSQKCDNDGRTPLHVLANTIGDSYTKRDCETVIKKVIQFIRFGGKSTIPDHAGQTPLDILNSFHPSARTNQAKLIKTLQKYFYHNK